MYTLIREDVSVTTDAVSVCTGVCTWYFVLFWAYATDDLSRIVIYVCTCARAWSWLLASSDAPGGTCATFVQGKGSIHYYFSAVFGL